MYQRETVEAMREKLHRARVELVNFEEAVKDIGLFGEVATRGERESEGYCMVGLVDGIKDKTKDIRHWIGAIESNVDGIEETYLKRQSEMDG